MLQGDVREMQDCEKAVAAATDRWGRLDILVNAAAGNFLAPAEILSPKGFKTGTSQALPFTAVYIHCSAHTTAAAIAQAIYFIANKTLHVLWYCLRGGI